MVESRRDRHTGSICIIVCPNMSACWNTTKQILFFFSIFVLLIAVVLSLFGFWVVLPFAGLELIALYSLSYWVAYQCCRKEVIRIEDNHLQLESGHYRIERCWRSELFWTRLVIDRPAHRGHDFKLFLKNRKQRIEIGSFLNEDDKKELLSALRPLLALAG